MNLTRHTITICALLFLHVVPASAEKTLLFDPEEDREDDRPHDEGRRVSNGDCRKMAVGRIVDKTVQLGIAERTLILVTGDNGTHRSLKSNMGDTVIVGGKGKPTDAGTHVALFGYQPGKVPAGSVSDDLVEFTDFM